MQFALFNPPISQIVRFVFSARLGFILVSFNDTVNSEPIDVRADEPVCIIAVSTIITAELGGIPVENLSGRVGQQKHHLARI